MDKYTALSLRISRDITRTYSTSFSLGIRLLSAKLRPAIFAIYGMVRMADEIVDTHFEIDQAAALADYKRGLWQAIADRYSPDPVKHSFQWAYHAYGIKKEWVESFFASMEMDLSETQYTPERYADYVYGSSEAVGLMCLPVLCEGNQALLRQVYEPAKRLGSAFQKVNFLRDIASDLQDRGRSYFPAMKNGVLTAEAKRAIEAEIEADFLAAWPGVCALPLSSRKGVRLAYRFYTRLLTALKNMTPEQLLAERARVSNGMKLLLLLTELPRV